MSWIWIISFVCVALVIIGLIMCYILDIEAGLVLSCLFGVLGFISIPFSVAGQVNYIHTSKLYSLFLDEESHTTISGLVLPPFIIGKAETKNERSYVFYREVENGEFILDTSDIENTRIKEVDFTADNAEYTEPTFVCRKELNTLSKTFILIVPVGTIVKVYSL